MTPLEERREELISLSKAYYTELPEWYIVLTVESYIKNEEAELMIYKANDEEEEEEDKIKITTVIETDDEAKDS